MTVLITDKFVDTFLCVCVCSSSTFFPWLTNYQNCVFSKDQQIKLPEHSVCLKKKHFIIYLNFSLMDVCMNYVKFEPF